MEQPTSLAQLLSSPGDLPWDQAIYLPRAKPWALDSPAIVCDPEDAENDEDPEVARLHGLAYALGTSAFQDVVDNALEQKPECTPADLLNALLFYYHNDSYISF